MNIRDAINEMLVGLDLGADPAEVLADHGFGDVSAEALSSALVHYSERAPLEVADALAPIVTRVSPVPLEAQDLPPLPEADAILDSGGDVFSLLTDVGLVDPSELSDLEIDPTGELDLDGQLGAVTETVDEAVETIEETVEEVAESTFGDGDEIEVPEIDVPDALGSFEDAVDALSEESEGLLDEAARLVEETETPFGDGLDTADFTDLFDSEAAGIDDLDDTDPSELDLE